MKILFVSTEFEEQARGITGIIKAMVAAAKEDGHEVGALVGYPKAGQKKSELLDQKVEHIYLQHYFETGKKNIFPTNLRSKKNQLKIIAGRDYLSATETRVNRDLIQKQSNLANKLDYIIKIPFVYHFINHGLGKISRRTIKKAVKKYNVDLVITGAPMELTKKDVYPAKLMQFVHDTMPIDMLETPADNKTPDRFARQLYAAVSSSDLVLTNSTDTSDKVHEINPDMPTQIVYGIASNKAQQFTDNAYLNRKQLEKDNYLLFVSVIEKRKNVETLMDAYAKVRSKINMPLVIVGAKGFGYKDIMAHYDDFPEDVKKDIIFTGFISETDKFALLNNARAFVFPSLYEGLGLPVIEAFASGLPVLTSNKGALPEAGGDAAIYVEDPYNTDEIAEKIFTIVTDEKLRQKLIEHQKEQTAKFTAETFNERFKKAIKSVS